MHLRSLNWATTLAETDTNIAFNNFWDIFKPAFDEHFPIKSVNRNKNSHKLNQFMTQGLFIARKNKNILHKKALKTPSDFNISKYRTYRNIYNATIRKSKKSFYEENLKNSKITPVKPGNYLMN
jgi:hypothetical protein